MDRAEMPQLILELEIEDEGAGGLEAAWLRRVVSDALAGRVAEPAVAVGLTVTGDEGIRQINREYRNLDTPTDVLSFPMLEFDVPQRPRPGFPLPPDEPLALGDIVVSYPRAVEQAASYGHSVDREIAFLLVHGVMHLLGYDHEAAADQEAMRREEEIVLGRLGLVR